LVAVQTTVEEFLKTDPYDQVAEQYQRPGNTELVVMHLKKRSDLPEALPLIVGDTIYNMRSALDHLAYSLCVANVGDRIKEGRSMFPIHAAVGSYMDSGVQACRQMSIEVQGIIERLQPYHAGNKASEHPLGVLNQLSNVDKHRHLVFTGSAEVRQEITLLPDSQDCELIAAQAEVRSGPFNDQTDVARVLIRRTGANPRPKLDTYITIDITFPPAGPAPGKLVTKELERIWLHIKNEVFPVLEPHL
jgi:hypothetical protein